jgi:putative MATE family efflux protein
MALPITGDEAPDETAWVTPPRHDLTHGPLDRALLRLAGPAIAAKALYAALALMDVLWVGRLGAAPTAAVNTGFFTSWILQAATALTAVGIVAHVSRHIGAGDRHRAAHAASQGLILGLGLGAVLAVGVWFAAPRLFELLGTAPEVSEPGIVYLRVFFLAAPLTFTWINSEAVMRAAGNTRTPLLIMCGMVLVNGGLAPLLIFGLGPFPRLEVLGAALATAFAQLLAVIAFASRALRADPSFPFPRPPRFDPGLCLRMVRLGVPATSVGFLYSMVYLFLSGVAARLGTRELAILGLGNRAETFTYLVSTGFAAATAAVVGQNLGAGLPERAARAAWRAALWMGIYGLIVGGCLILWPRAVLGLFTSDPAVLELGATYTRIIGSCQGLMAAEIVLGQAFAGAGDTLPPMLISVPVNLLRIPLVFWIVRRLDGGIVGIGWLLAMTAAFRGVASMVWFARGTWKEKKL